MSRHYRTVKIVEKSDRDGGPITIDIQVFGERTSIEMAEDEWHEIVMDWASYYQKTRGERGEQGKTAPDS